MIDYPFNLVDPGSGQESGEGVHFHEAVDLLLGLHTWGHRLKKY
jgi:hypothetical protein